MDDYTDELSRTFSELETDELLGKLNSGGLTEVAQIVAKAELIKRGNSLTAVDSGSQETPATTSFSPEQLALLRNSSRASFLVGGVAIAFASGFIRILLGTYGSNSMLETATRIIGSSILGGLFWGYVAWFAWSRLRYRR